LVNKQKSYRRKCLPTQTEFSTDYISALRGCGPLKFIHAIEIDQGLTPNGNGGAPQKFKGEHVELGLKFRVLAPITLGVTKLFHATCREAEVFKWAQLLGKARSLKFRRAKNV